MVMRATKSKSQKMRELAAAGMSRADIARKLDVRYQFVRNVLEKDRARKEAQSSAGGFSDNAQKPMSELRPAKVRLGPDGRVVIPAAFREALAIKEGETLIASVEDGTLQLMTIPAAVRKAQAMVRRFVPEGVSLVDELLEERRREVERERQHG
jgi:AbrB family looped-hinge helix DNA binding protein